MSSQTETANPEMQPAPAEAASKARSKRALLGCIAAILVALGVVFGIRYWRFAASHEETDDAEVEGDVSPVLPRVSGYVARVFARDNEHVSAGQALVAIDPAELDLAAARAESAERSSEVGFRTAEANLTAAEAAVAVARANIETARVRREKTAADLAQDRGLFASGAITDRDWRDSREADDAAEAQFVMAQREAEMAAAQVAVAASKVRAAEADLAGAKASLDFARLQRSYATVTAPIDGIVARKSVEPGQFVQAGEMLLSVVSDANVWVVANFKETQVGRMRPGQEAEFTADSYPGAVFRGRIDSLSGATGARFALLPPDNASGNFVKVTQRVPVKIVPEGAPDRPLRPGMSVDATVDVGF